MVERKQKSHKRNLLPNLVPQLATFEGESNSLIHDIINVYKRSNKFFELQEIRFIKNYPIISTKRSNYKKVSRKYSQLFFYSFSLLLTVQSRTKMNNKSHFQGNSNVCSQP
jgi:hypothetical protein